MINLLESSVNKSRNSGRNGSKSSATLTKNSLIVFGADLLAGMYRQLEMLFSNNHELLDSLLSRITVGYPSDSVASHVLGLQIIYVLYMLSMTAGRIEVRVGDTNASFRISRLPISIFQYIW